MGLLNKIKGILFDEEEIELPEIKKEEVKEKPKKQIVEEEKVERDPIKEIKLPKEDFSDKENYKSKLLLLFQWILMMIF